MERGYEEKSLQTELKKANKLTFQFDSSGLIGYGDCSKLHKPVSFMAGICLLHTQECFIHRRETLNT